MGEKTGITWTHHTLNIWWGCEKISIGCSACYAETWSKRLGLSLWGPAADRRFFGDKYWAQPLKWDKKAAAAGERRRVFCASMADVFEDYKGPKETRAKMDEARARLWELIEKTPNLDWLLLTKRPENIMGMVPQAWAANGLPKNAWPGTTIENQDVAEDRLVRLLEIPAFVHWLSVEPLLGRLDLDIFACLKCLKVYPCSRNIKTFKDQCPSCGYSDENLWQEKYRALFSDIDQVIVGGESGDKARPMHPDWARTIRNRAKAYGIAFHFKQWGEWLPICSAYDPDLLTLLDEYDAAGTELVCIESSGSIAQVSGRGKDRTFHQPDETGWWMAKVGAKQAGRVLDRAVWDEFPVSKGFISSIRLLDLPKRLV